MYLSDRAASVATDAALELDAFRKESRIRGWVTQAHDDAVAVTFIDAEPSALYRATVSNAGKLVGKVEAYATPQPLSLRSRRVRPLRARLHLARSSSRAANATKTGIRMHFLWCCRLEQFTLPPAFDAK